MSWFRAFGGVPRSAALLLRLSSALVLLAVVAPITAHARTITVPRCTNPPCRDTADVYQTIDSALTYASKGDRIYIKRGTYVAPPGGWRITRSVEIFGDGPGQETCTWLQPADDYNPVLVVDFSETGVDSVLSNIYIHDLRIARALPPTSSHSGSNGIECITLPSRFLLNFRLARLTIADMRNDGIHLVGGDGAYSLVSVTIDEVHSARNRGHGLYAVNVTEMNIRGGIYNFNWRRGVYLAACEARLIGAEIGANEIADEGVTASQLNLEGCHAFFVTGCHFEGFDAQPNAKTAVTVANCYGGYIGSCTFGNGGDQSSSRGIYVNQSVGCNGIVVGPNSWYNVGILVEIQDDPLIRSCTVLPQSVQTGDSSRIIVPETVDRGHMVFSATTNTSNTTAGVTLPMISATARDAMTAAASGGTRRTGLLLYNSDAKALNYWDGGRWASVGSLGNADTNCTNVNGPISNRPLLTAPAQGLYRLTVYAVTRLTLSVNHTINVRWTDSQGPHMTGYTLAKAAGSLFQRCEPIYIGSGNLTFDTSGNVGAGSFDLFIRVEAMP